MFLVIVHHGRVFILDFLDDQSSEVEVSLDCLWDLTQRDVEAVRPYETFIKVWLFFVFQFVQIVCS